MKIDVKSCVVRSINGVKEMRGFRMTFNISFNQGEDLDVLNQTDSMQCGSKDDVDTSALLVHVNQNVKTHFYCTIFQGTIVSIFSIGALVGALLSGLLSDLAGRKVTVIIGASTCLVGGSLQVASFYLWSDPPTPNCC